MKNKHNWWPFVIILSINLIGTSLVLHGYQSLFIKHCNWLLYGFASIDFNSCINDSITLLLLCVSLQLSDSLTWVTLLGWFLTSCVTGMVSHSFFTAPILGMSGGLGFYLAYAAYQAIIKRKMQTKIDHYYQWAILVFSYFMMFDMVGNTLRVHAIGIVVGFIVVLSTKLTERKIKKNGRKENTL